MCVCVCVCVCLPHLFGCWYAFRYYWYIHFLQCMLSVQPHFRQGHTGEGGASKLYTYIRFGTAICDVCTPNQDMRNTSYRHTPCMTSMVSLAMALVASLFFLVSRLQCQLSNMRRWLTAVTGFAAIRELSAKWALAVSLGLDRDEEDEHHSKTPSMKSRRRKTAGPRNTVGGCRSLCRPTKARLKAVKLLRPAFLKPT